MAIHNLYSKRQKALRGEDFDVYTYDNLPQPLKNQIVYIWKDTLGDEGDYRRDQQVIDVYKFIVDTLCREYGLPELPTVEKNKYGTYLGESIMYLDALADYLLEVDEVERQLDIVELSFQSINRINRKGIAKYAIDELNTRFKEHGVGYQFIENKIMRVDSELIHSEAVKPALRLLGEKSYKGAQEEFLNGYQHYRHGKHKEAIIDCSKAFESTMKAICDKRKWSYQQNDTAKALIKICFDNYLVPQFWQQNLTSLRSLLESSIPTGRNNLGAHGQGTKLVEVPAYLVAYMLHMTASTLLFLITAEKNLVKEL